jgi:hypothetical protein
MPTRTIVLIITLVFIAGLAALTINAFAQNGFSVVGVIAIGILVLFSVGIVGALRTPPRQ